MLIWFGKCRCLGWKKQNKAVDSRTCKHLREYLGSEFEDARVGPVTGRGSTRGGASAETPSKGSSRIAQHINIKPLLLAHKYTDRYLVCSFIISNSYPGCLYLK